MIRQQVKQLGQMMNRCLLLGALAALSGIIGLVWIIPTLILTNLCVGSATFSLHKTMKKALLRMYVIFIYSFYFTESMSIAESSISLHSSTTTTSTIL